MNYYYYLIQTQPIQQNSFPFENISPNYIKKSLILVLPSPRLFFPSQILFIYNAPLNLPPSFINFSQIKELSEEEMCDMQVMINNSQYQILKQTEKECVVLRKKNKELSSEVGILERSIKEKDEIISRNKKEIKELSKNALNLSKKVITTDDLFINQEQKWLMRERELLEKNMNCLKIKEQFEEGWKREKHTLQIKEQKYQEILLKLSTLESEMVNEKKHRKKYEKQLKHVQLLSKQKEERFNAYVNEDKLQKDQLQKEIEQFVSKEDELKLMIDEKDAIIAKMEIEQQISAETHTKEVKQQASLIESLKYELVQATNCLQYVIENLKKQVKSLKNMLEQVRAQKQRQRQIWNQSKKKIFDQIPSITKELSICKDQMRQLVLNTNNQLSSVTVFLEMRLQTLTSQMQNQFKTLENTTSLLNTFRAQNAKLKSQYSNVKNQLTAQQQKLIQDRDALKKTVQETQQEKGLLFDNNQHINNKILTIKSQLKSEIENRKKWEEESTLSKKKVERLTQTVAFLERQLEEQKREQIEREMNTEVIQIQEEAIYGKDRGKKHSDFKDIIDSFWVPINLYCRNQEAELKQNKGLKDIAGEIVRQEFEIIMKRFQYHFKRDYGKKQ